MLNFLMSNEALTFVQIFLAFTITVVAYRLFGKIGLFVMAGVFTLYANLEVANMATIFGLAVSLGNVSFVGNALVQDVLNENEGEKTARWTVWFGFLGCLAIMLISQVSTKFTPNEFDTIHESFKAVFGPFSLVTIVSLVTFLISNTMNVKLYAFFSKYTKMPWLRSQASTWISQLADTLIMTFVCSVLGIFAWDIFWELILTTYIIKIIVAACEIPFIYWAKNLKQRGKVREILEIA